MRGSEGGSCGAGGLIRVRVSSRTEKGRGVKSQAEYGVGKPKDLNFNQLASP